jgi:hypothetical protein
MPAHRRIFVKDLASLEKTLCGLKGMACPFCGRIGALNRHGPIEGNDPQAAEGCLRRGHRVYCCARGRRGGCGRTFPVLLAHVLPRHTFTASLLWSVLHSLLGGRSIRAAWMTAGKPLALETNYHLIQRLRSRLFTLRSVLSTLLQPPAVEHRDPLLQTLEHLRQAFPACPCPVESFQHRLQRPWLTG